MQYKLINKKLNLFKFSRRILFLYRGFHEKGTLSYLCALGIDRCSPLNECTLPIFVTLSHNFFSSEEGKIKTRYYYFHKKARKKFQVTLKGTGPLSKIHCIRNILTNKLKNKESMLNLK